LSSSDCVGDGGDVTVSLGVVAGELGSWVITSVVGSSVGAASLLAGGGVVTTVECWTGGVVVVVEVVAWVAG